MITAPLSARLDEVAAAVAERVPAGGPLQASSAIAVEADTDLSNFAAAVAAEFVPPLEGRIAVLVGADLVEALSQAPAGALDLASALQPTVDAAAGALSGSAGQCFQIDVQNVIEALGAGAHLIVLDNGSDTQVAVLVSGLAESDGARPAVASAVTGQPLAARGIELLRGVVMEVTVELGRTRMSVRDLLSLAPGAVLELDRAAGSPADLLVNGQLIARGEVVVVDEEFGLRITEVIDGAEVA